MCGHFRRSTPKVGLEMVLNVPPLDLFLEFEVGRSYHRLRGLLDGPLYPSEDYGHHARAKRIFEDANLDEVVPDFCEVRLGKRYYKVKKPSFDRGTLYEDVGRLRLFTDGSKLSTKDTGYGVVYEVGNGWRGYGQYLGKEASVYQAEALAITAACGLIQNLLDTPEAPRAVSIYSDSQAVLRALSGNWVKSRVILECSRALSEIGRCISVQLCWIKGHSGVEGNERADAAAREAAASQGPLPATAIPRSSAYYRAAFKDHLYVRWTERWSAMEPSFARQTRIWFSEPSFRKTRRLLSLSRSTFSRAVRWITGHAFLGLQNFRCGSEATSACRLCGLVPERADHLLLECPKLAVLRSDCFRVWEPARNPRWEVDWIVKFVESPTVLRLESRQDCLSGGDDDDDDGEGAGADPDLDGP